MARDTQLFQTFRGAAKRIEDVDLPRIGRQIGVGEDELHAFMDTETRGSGFDHLGRPKALFEPHVAWRCSAGEVRERLAAAGLAYPRWGEKPYPADSYPSIKRAAEIDETVAFMATSWGLFQVLGKNFAKAGYPTVQAMVFDFLEDEDNHVEAAVRFMTAAGIDDDLRALAKLKRPTKPSDCVPIVRVWNGEGFRKNRYDEKFAAAHNRWRGIKDTAFADETPPKPAIEMEIAARDSVRLAQRMLRDKGYPQVGNPDGKIGSRTRGAIRAFQGDKSLTADGRLTPGFLRVLAEAPKREEAPERARATKADVADTRSVKLGDRVQKLGGGVILAGVGTLVENVVNGDTSQIESAVATAHRMNAAWEAIASLGLPVLIILGGGAVLWFGRGIIAEQIEAYREGRHV